MFQPRGPSAVTKLEEYRFFSDLPSTSRAFVSHKLEEYRFFSDLPYYVIAQQHSHLHETASGVHIFTHSIRWTVGHM